MIDEIHELTKGYYKWLLDNTDLEQLEGCVEITTPFLDRHRDHMQIYVDRADSGFLLSDDGYTINDLETSGCKLDTPKRRALLNQTLNGFGVKLAQDEMQVKATVANFSQQKHRLLQAMIAVDDLFYLASPYTKSFFQEDVVDWLKLSDIRCVPGVKLAGKTGFYNHFDFVIPGSNDSPERMLLSINTPNRSNAKNAILTWIDTREARSGDSLAYAILNDNKKTLHPDILDAFRNYDVRPVPWSERESVREELAA